MQIYLNNNEFNQNFSSFSECAQYLKNSDESFFYLTYDGEENFFANKDSALAYVLDMMNFRPGAKLDYVWKIGIGEKTSVFETNEEALNFINANSNEQQVKIGNLSFTREAAIEYIVHEKESKLIVDHLHLHTRVVSVRIPDVVFRDKERIRKNSSECLEILELAQLFGTFEKREISITGMWKLGRGYSGNLYISTDFEDPAAACKFLASMTASDGEFSINFSRYFKLFKDDMNVEAVKFIIRQLSSAAFYDLFIDSITQRDLVKITFYHKIGFNFKNRTDMEKPSAIIYAIQTKNIDAVKFLIHLDPTCITAEPGSAISKLPLHAAIVSGSLEIVKLFDPVYGEKGADFIGAAIKSGNVEMLEYVVDSLGITSVFWREKTDFVEIAVEAGNVDVLKYVTEKLQKLTSNYCTFIRYLLIAIEKNHNRVLKFLLDNKTVNFPPESNEALRYAIDLKRYDLAKLLIENGVDLLEHNGNGDSILHTAAKKGIVEILEPLAERLGVDVKNSLGYTPLYYAADRNKSEAIKTLLALGASV